MPETEKGRSSAEVVIVKRGIAGRRDPVMSIRFAKSAGVTFADGGRLLFSLVKLIQDEVVKVDPDYFAEWRRKTLSSLPVLEPFEGTLEVVFDGGGDVEEKPVVRVRSGASHRIGRAGDVVTIWREKEGAL